jgi:hypothetical protein
MKRVQGLRPGAVKLWVTTERNFVHSPTLYRVLRDAEVDLVPALRREAALQLVGDKSGQGVAARRCVVGNQSLETRRSYFFQVIKG